MGLRNSQKFFSYIFKSFGSKFRSNKIIYQNLEIFNPNITLNEKKVISQQMWSNYGKTFIEYIFLDKYKKKEHFTNGQAIWVEGCEASSVAELNKSSAAT